MWMTLKHVIPLAPHTKNIRFVLFIGYWLTCLRMDYLKELISKKVFTLDDLNNAILKFPYKWVDRTNKPHIVPQSFSRRRTVRGNAHENWSLLRFLPFLIGSHVPKDEPAWFLLMDLKEITELVVVPVLCDDSLAFLESKIMEH